MVNKIRSTHRIAIILIILTGCLLYGNSLLNTFVYNDHQMVSQNPFIESFDNVKHFFGEKYFTGSGEKTFRPVVTLSFMMDHSLWGGKPAGYHFTNMAIHVANALLLYFITSFLLSSLFPKRVPEEIRVRSFSLTLPLIAALLFTMHPVETEGVLSIGSRHDLVMTFFYLASLLSYYHAFRNKSGKTLLLTVSLSVYMLSMLSKEMGVTLPAVIILIDILVYGLIVFRARFRYYAMYFALALMFIAIRFIFFTYSVDAVGDYYSARYLYGGAHFSHILTSISVLGYYLKLFIYPISLSLEYMPRIIYSVIDPAFLASLTALTGLIVISVKASEKYPFITIGGFWIILTLMPVSNIFVLLLSTSMSERFLYLPAVGFNVLLAGVIFWAAGVFKTKAAKTAETIVLSGIIGLVFFYGSRTLLRTFDWRNDKIFWEASARDEFESSRTHNNLAMVYFYEGKYDEAISELNLSLGIREDPLTRVNLAFAYYEMGRYPEASRELEKVLGKDPEYAPALYHMALVELKEGKQSEAMGLLVRALKEYPGMKDRPFYAEACNAAGSILFAKGDYDQARGMYEKSIGINPDFIQPRYLLAKIFLKKGLINEAETQYLIILERDPAHIDARNNLANIYFSKGYVDKALQEYLRILEEAPDHFRARNNLANIYLSKGDYDKAIEEYNTILLLNPDSAIVHYNLGLAYSGKGMHRESVGEWEKALLIEPSLAPARKALNRIRGISEDK